MSVASVPSAFPLSILVVEDEPAVREALADLLRLDGHRVIAAPDGGAALQLATPGRFQLVLADLVMPLMAGDVLLRELRARGGPRCWRALMSSVHGSVVRWRLRDVDRFLAKPVHPDTLAALTLACAQDPAIAGLLATTWRGSGTR